MTESAQNAGSKKIPARRILLIGAAFILGFIILGVIAIQVWDYSNSVSFCTNACHDVHPEEPAAYLDSYHANVKCTECHMGRLGTLHSIVLKAGHYRHLPEVILDRYERPLRSATMRPANESCEKCHWPAALHGDTVRQIKRFQPDETNSETDTYLILKTGGGRREVGLGVGIHWHIANPVEYIASDEDKQAIRWVRTTLPDGRTVEYSDITNPLSAQEIASSEKKVMDCVDCHNRVGHPFSSPEELVDQALADGRLSKELPYAKQEMLRLLTADYNNREEALVAVAALKQQYTAENPETAANYPAEIDQAAEVAKELVTGIVFEEPGVNWRSFPDNGRHKDFAGCFRCHDGKHVSVSGESIRLHCNICHNVPETVSAGDRPPQVPLAYIQEPASHREANFIADHRFQANTSCVECHGELQFGTDNSSFCANSSCHGQPWPAVQLDAAFTHPIPLEGKHAAVWCHQCHEGVRKPEYKCANCHQPPMQPHFGEQCEECHTPAGFEQATLTDFQHPVLLEGAHAALQCSQCHEAGKELIYQCSTCHQPPSQPHFGDNCEQCHKPTSFKEATLTPEQHPIPLLGAHARATCEVCHADGQRVPEYLCSNCHKPPENHFDGSCDTCHSPEGWSKAAAGEAAAPATPHELAGREDCFQCHDPAGNIKPAPANHAEFAKEQCTTCHKAAEGGASPVTAESSAGGPPIPHNLEGQTNCVACHDPAGKVKPAPANHAGYGNELCTGCHQPA